MSLINQIEGIFVSQVPNPQFIIYTNQVVDPDPQTSSLSSSVAIRFNQLYDIAFSEAVKIAFEPMEKSKFSSDSIQQQPTTIFATCIASPWMQNTSYTNQDYRNDLKKVLDQLQDYKTNKTLLTLIANKPMLETYSNYHITGFKYDLSPRGTHLRAYINFQEVRIVTSSQTGTLQQSQVSNPASTSTVQTGQVSPQTPTPTQTQTVESIPFS